MCAGGLEETTATPRGRISDMYDSSKTQRPRMEQPEPIQVASGGEELKAVRERDKKQQK